MEYPNLSIGEYDYIQSLLLKYCGIQNADIEHLAVWYFLVNLKSNNQLK